jgi:hypothetical protein
MAQAVSPRSLTTDARVCVWVSPCGICVEELALGQVSLRVLPVSPVPVIPPWLFTVNLYITWGMNNRPARGRSSETSSHSIDMSHKMLCVQYRWSVFTQFEICLLWSFFTKQLITFSQTGRRTPFRLKFNNANREITAGFPQINQMINISSSTQFQGVEETWSVHLMDLLYEKRVL